MTEVTGKKIMYLITQSKYGGAQKYVLQLARHFQTSNNVQLVVGDSGNQDPTFFKEARDLGIEPLISKDLVRDISLVKAFDALLELRSLLAKEKPDILHINSSMAGAIGSCAAWLYGFDPLNPRIRVVYTVHGFVFNEPLSRMRKWFYIMIEKISASWKHAIICVSEYDKAEGLKHKIAPERRMTVIHNGIDPALTFLSRENARNKLTIPASALVIGTIASLYKTKGIEYLIGALSLLRKKDIAFFCVIIGEGPERKNLEDIIDKEGLSSCIMLAGYKPDAFQYLKAFDIFVLPSVKEGFPYALLEAGNADLPIVATRVGGIPEILAPECVDALVDPANPQQLATTLEHFVSSPQEREGHAYLCTKKITSQFTRERMLADTDHLYMRLYKTVAPRTTQPS